MKKKLMALALAALFIIGLPGCGGGDAGEPVTAESLMAGVPEIDPDLYSDIVVAVAVGTESDGSGEGMTLVMGVESAGGIRHIYDAEATVGSGDDTMTVGMEGWADVEAGMIYSNMSYAGMESGWSKSSAGLDSTVMDASGAASSVRDIWDGVEFRLSEEDYDNYYVVEWDVSAEAMSGAAGDMGGMFEPDNFGSMSGAAAFRKQDKALESVQVTAENAEGGQFLFYVEFHAVNGDGTLEIPSDIIESAVDGDDPDAYAPHDSGRGWLTYDDGSDEYIDAAADSMAAWCSGEGWVMASHYESFSQMAAQDQRDGWVGAMDLQRANMDGYPEMAADTYADQAAWYKDAYGEESLVFESGTEAMYIVGHKTLAYTALVADDAAVAVEVTMDGDPDDDTGAIGALDEMLAAAGLPERGAP